MPSNDLRFDGKVALITGAGNGLGRSHALLLGARGAKVVINDLGGGAKGGGKSSEAADKVVAEIKAAGGEAVANYDSVEDGAKIVQCAMDSFGGIDIVVNNAGILRDTSFQKMTEDDWDLVYRVHVLGAYRVTTAAWNHMRDKGYGRIVFTASAAGIYGNFGQANYAMAKLGLVGLSNTLAIEGKKKNVLVNTIAPIAGSRLTETILPKELIDALKPEYVSPLVAYLCHESNEDTGGLYEVGGGFFAKLRWQRAEGKTYRRGRVLSPESIKADWGSISGFEKVTYPADVMQSMAPILDNVNAPPTKGANEFIDVDQALGFEFPEVKSTYDERDLSLYALGVGAGTDPTNTKELEMIYELHGDGFKALPTYAVVPAVNVVLGLAKDGVQPPGMNYGLDRILHGEQLTEIVRPLPSRGKLTHKAKIKDIFDKGKMAVVVTEVKTFDEDGELLARNEVTTAIRGAGGFGGERGTAVEVPVPDRAPDAVVTEKIPDNQALFYRLSGDWNPLHVDPDFAKAFGFPKPILHGLCTFGYAGRNVIAKFAKDADPRYFKAIRVRFADSVFPGETLITEMWKESDARVLVRCKVKERDKVVLSNAYVEFYPEIPKAVAKAKSAGGTGAAASGASPSNGPTSAQVFGALGAYIAKHPDVAAKAGVLYEWQLKSPDSVFTMDLKNAPGGVTPGPATKPECTLEISDQDFLDMVAGKADAQKLYFAKKLKIGGNIMASQKLEFLKKMDPKEFADLLTAQGGSSAVAASTSAGENARGAGVQATTGSAVAPKAKEVFATLQKRFTDSKGAINVDGPVQLAVRNPDARALVGKEGVQIDAEDRHARAWLTIDDSDLALWSEGKLSMDKLFQQGKLRVDGDVRAARTLAALFPPSKP